GHESGRWWYRRCRSQPGGRRWRYHSTGRQLGGRGELRDRGRRGERNGRGKRGNRGGRGRWRWPRGWRWDRRDRTRRRHTDPERPLLHAPAATHEGTVGTHGRGHPAIGPVGDGPGSALPAFTRKSRLQQQRAAVVRRSGGGGGVPGRRRG